MFFIDMDTHGRLFSYELRQFFFLVTLWSSVMMEVVYNKNIYITGIRQDRKNLPKTKLSGGHNQNKNLV